MPLYQPVNYYDAARGSIEPLSAAQRRQDQANLESKQIANQTQQIGLEALQGNAPYQTALSQLNTSDPAAIQAFNQQFPNRIETTKEFLAAQQGQAGQLGLQNLPANATAGEVDQFGRQHPGQAKAAQESYKFRDEQDRASAKRAAGGMNRAAQSGNKEEVYRAIDQYAEDIIGSGDERMTPDVMKQEYDKDPEGFEARMANVFQTAGGKAEDLGGQKPLTAYQAGQLKIGTQANTIKKEAAALKALENDSKKLTTKLNNAKTVKATEKLQQDIETKAQEQKVIQKNIYNKGTDAQKTLSDHITLLEDLLTDDGLKSAVGWQGSLYSPSGSAAAGFESKLETVNSKAFISAIQNVAGMGLGALSDAEGKKLGSALGNLRTTMSEADFKTEVERIVKVLVQEREVIKGRTPRDPDFKAPPAALEYLKANPQEIDNFEKQFKYRPEGY